MSHIFISYAHGDRPYLDSLVSWLRTNGFAEQDFWYDQHIEGGNNWRDEIVAALDDAFAVMVIVTANSVKSLFCTYEWAYAMGQGVSILPVVFNELSIGDVPAPLRSRQMVDCADGIPDYLKDQLNQLRTVPPQVAAINKLVYEAVYDTHRRFFILGWLGEHLIALDSEFRGNVLAYFARGASEAYRILQEVMIEKSFALNRKQYRLCWKLVDFLREFSELDYHYEDYLPEHLFAQFESEWLPAFEYFEANNEWWSRWRRPNFERNLEDEHIRMEVFAEMIKAFPIFHGSDVDVLLRNKRLEQKRRRGADSIS